MPMTQMYPRSHLWMRRAALGDLGKGVTLPREADYKKRRVHLREPAWLKKS